MSGKIKRLLVSFSLILSGCIATPSVSGDSARARISSTIGAESIGAEPNLPFSLALDDTPEDLTDIVDILYESLPQEHLARIASYFGHIGYEEWLAHYGNEDDFYESLFIDEIVRAALERWGLISSHHPINRSIECVGDNFSEQVALQLGMRYTYWSQEGPIRLHSGVSYAYAKADIISKRLFYRCDQAHLPRDQ